MAGTPLSLVGLWKDAGLEVDTKAETEGVTIVKTKVVETKTTTKIGKALQNEKEVEGTLSGLVQNLDRIRPSPSAQVDAKIHFSEHRERDEKDADLMSGLDNLSNLNITMIARETTKPAKKTSGKYDVTPTQTPAAKSAPVNLKLEEPSRPAAVSLEVDFSAFDSFADFDLPPDPGSSSARKSKKKSSKKSKKSSSSSAQSTPNSSHLDALAAKAQAAVGAAHEANRTRTQSGKQTRDTSSDSEDDGHVHRSHQRQVPVADLQVGEVRNVSGNADVLRDIEMAGQVGRNFLLSEMQALEELSNRLKSSKQDTDSANAATRAQLLPSTKVLVWTKCKEQKAKDVAGAEKRKKLARELESFLDGIGSTLVATASASRNVQAYRILLEDLRTGVEPGELNDRVRATVESIVEGSDAAPAQRENLKKAAKDIGLAVANVIRNPGDEPAEAAVRQEIQSLMLILKGVS